MATTAGGLPYVEPSDLVSGWPAVSQDLAEELDSQLAAKLATADYKPGLAPIVTAPLSSSSVSVNNCFTADYDVYRVVIIGATSADATILMRYRVAGADDTGNNYSFQQLNVSGTSVSANRTTATSSTRIGQMGPQTSGIAIDIYGPWLAASTRHYAMNVSPFSTVEQNVFTGNHSDTGSYTGFTIYNATFASGSVRVYGYRNG